MHVAALNALGDVCVRFATILLLSFSLSLFAPKLHCRGEGIKLPIEAKACWVDLEASTCGLRSLLWAGKNLVPNFGGDSQATLYPTTVDCEHCA